MKFASTATTESFLKRPRLSHTSAPSSHPGRRLRHLFPSLLLLLSYLALLLRIADANDRPTLYAPGDNVLELDVNTFDKTVYHKPTAFFIEFYSSWCGHCIEYKPHYVRFATMLKDWRNAVVIGVINCADELNAPTCREHAIDGFPTLKYFHVNARGKDDTIRFDENKFDLPLMAKKITEWVKADFDKGLAPSSFPRLQFETDDKTLSSLWSSNTKPNAQLLAIVVDKEPATQAYSLLLNYAGDPRLGLALCSPSHPIVQARLADLPTPRLLVFSRSNPDQPVFKSEAPIESWLEMQKKLDELLAPYPKPEMPPLDSLKNSGKQGSAAIASAAAADAQKQEQPLVVNWNQFEVQYQDLVAALHYMLTVEVPRNPVLGSLELKTLKRFVHLIRQHGPGSVPARRLFFRLDEWLTAQQQPVVATDAYLGKLEEFQTDLGHPIPANVSYLACRGSKSYLRGYTCGLWTLFHLLTVQAYKERKDDPKFDPVSEVLEPIHQFIVQFLSCEACSKHFDKMASEDGLLNVHRPEDVVLWLWRAHNKVNTRLRGEASEDPKFPKQQFPPASLCPECRRGDGQLEEFDEQKVLQFMVRYYSDVKIDKYKPAPGYKVSEFANGKLEKVAHKNLNPKFEPMAGKVDRLEEIEAKMRSQQEAGLKRHWKPIEDDYRGIGESSNLHHIWLVLIAMALIVAYFQYRRNRSKFWKIFYYYNDYKVLPWQRDASTSTMNLDKYHA